MACVFDRTVRTKVINKDKTLGAILPGKIFETYMHLDWDLYFHCCCNYGGVYRQRETLDDTLIVSFD